jgi:hypothetical protein
MDCGEEDHILCSEEAYRAYYQRQDEGTPSDFKNLDFKELRGYVGKHLVSLHLRNISGKDDQGGEVGNPSPPQPRWELELEASPGEVSKFLLQHLSAKSLTFVGITNEDKVFHINSTLRKEGRNAEHSSADQKPAWERLELFFLKPDLYHLVVEDRDTPTRKQRLREALETLQGLCRDRLLRLPSNKSPGDTAVIKESIQEKEVPELVCRWYECFPYVGLSAVDSDRENGVIRFSPHFWGKRVQEIPGFVLRWVSERPSRLYELYRDTLDHLRTQSSAKFPLDEALKDLAQDPEAVRGGTQEDVAPH